MTALHSGETGQTQSWPLRGFQAHGEDGGADCHSWSWRSSGAEGAQGGRRGQQKRNGHFQSQVARRDTRRRSPESHRDPRTQGTEPLSSTEPSIQGQFSGQALEWPGSATSPATSAILSLSLRGGSILLNDEVASLWKLPAH